MSAGEAAPKRPAEVPPTFPGFERINRYFEMSTGYWIAQILPGDFYVTQNDEIISTVLGSCVSTCMRDPKRGIGGMNHFMLPEDPGGREGASARYGVFAMEQLINAFLTRGARREALEIKVVGGGRVIPGLGDVGRSNVDFVREFLEAEGMPIQVEDVGLEVARRVRYRARTGQMRVLHLPVSQNSKIAARESEAASRIQDGVRRRPSVELF
jgi:chemotaxis protein CheD